MGTNLIIHLDVYLNKTYVCVCAFFLFSVTKVNLKYPFVSDLIFKGKYMSIRVQSPKAHIFSARRQFTSKESEGIDTNVSIPNGHAPGSRKLRRLSRDAPSLNVPVQKGKTYSI